MREQVAGRKMVDRIAEINAQSNAKHSHLAALCELVSGTLCLALPFELPETEDSVYQQLNLRPGQLLTKCRHAGFASGNYRSQLSRTGNAGILFPPFRIREIRRVKKVALRSVATAVNSVTADAVSVEQFIDQPGLCGTPPLKVAPGKRPGLARQRAQGKRRRT